ncbi:DUF4174 domain-containing protein [Congregibacter brevis]|uniref:DUF4174 domain-containing protein n=1 Tax=Congregibacter brevis TaxID=3081201 RepID=A0ABZ0IGT2_9GAMM|nr:DUF4174 domain-containing protein [Congregibacter sp. IMCC45268]
MKHALTVLYFWICSASFGQALPMLTDLGELRWQHRILVINEPDHPAELLELLTENAGALDERKLAWFVIVAGDLRSNYGGDLHTELLGNINRRLGITPQESVLIGLDGGVKARGQDVDLEALYGLIDAMPMRRLEKRS